MQFIDVEVLEERDRPAMVQMLEDAGDLEPATIEMYRFRRALPDVILAARVNNDSVGMLNASYGADLHDVRSFESFDLPRPPHVFLDRIHVHPSMRRSGVGEALVGACIQLAGDNGCTFAGGHIDATSDPTGRMKFFDRLGFGIHGQPPEFTAGLDLRR